MATIAVQPVLLKNLALVVAADNYSAHVSTVEIVPSTSIQTWKGGNAAAVFTGVTNPTWTVNLTYAQDWATANSLSAYLFNNQGKSVVIKFVPETAATGTVPTWTVTALIIPGTIGGAVDGFMSASVTLGVIGQPSYAVAAAPAA